MGFSGKGVMHAKQRGRGKWGWAFGSCMMQDVRTNEFKEDSNLIRLEFQKNQSGSKVDSITESPNMYLKNIV